MSRKWVKMTSTTKDLLATDIGKHYSPDVTPQTAASHLRKFNKNKKKLKLTSKMKKTDPVVMQKITTEHINVIMYVFELSKQ